MILIFNLNITSVGLSGSALEIQADPFRDAVLIFDNESFDPVRELLQEYPHMAIMIYKRFPHE